MTLYVLCCVIFAAGAYCATAKRNAAKMIMGIVIMQYSAVLLLVILGYSRTWTDVNARMAAGAILAAGTGVTIVLVAIARRIYERFGTLDVEQIRKLKG